MVRYGLDLLRGRIPYRSVSSPAGGGRRNFFGFNESGELVIAEWAFFFAINENIVVFLPGEHNGLEIGPGDGCLSNPV